MTVEAYLCVSPHPTDFPTEHYDDFVAEEHILAVAEDTTPLLWLAMFRPSDVGGPGAAPVTSRRQALTNLYASVPVLDRLFAGSVATHAELLREAMRWLPGAFVTIEWWVAEQPEIGIGETRCPTPNGLGAVLALLELGTPESLEAAEQLTGLRAGVPLVPARALLPPAVPTADDRTELARILGRSHLRMVPWEVPF